MSKSINLRSYQKKAVNFLAGHPRANFYASMGLGKTAVVLETIRQLDLKDVLIIAPLRVVQSVWPDEILKWNDYHDFVYRVIQGRPEERIMTLNTPARIKLINFENVMWLVEYLGDKWPFTTVICDESTRLKGFRLRSGTKRSQALARIAHKNVNRWINMTGTPAPNGLIDLWGQNWFIDGGRALGRTFSSFLQRWFTLTPVGRGQFRTPIPLPHARTQIEAAMKANTLVIQAKEIFGIDEPIFSDVYVELPEPAREQYRQMERLFYTELEKGLVTAANAAVKTGKLLQMASGAVYHEDHTWSPIHAAKLDALQSIITEAAGANIMVAYQFVSDCERIKTYFPQARELRDKGAINDWNAGKVSLLLAHPKSAGHGLNLQHGGNILVFFGHDWNLEDYLQIMERIGPTRQRQSGYDRSVFIYNIIARHTMDELVRQRRQSKKDVMELLLEALREETSLIV